MLLKGLNLDAELTDKENMILRFIVHGLTNLEIGDKFHTSEGVIKILILRMKKKTGARNRARFVVFFYERDYSA